MAVAPRRSERIAGSGKVSHFTRSKTVRRVAAGCTEEDDKIYGRDCGILPSD